MMKIGSHVSLNGEDQFLGSVKEAISYNANTFMVYTGAPQNTIRRDISELKIEEAHDLMAMHKLLKEDVIVHAPYIVNLANPDIEKQDFAIAFITEEVKRTNAIGSKIMVLHPGAHMKEGSELGIIRIANGLNKIIENTSNLDVVIALESMAGKGSEVGRSFHELKDIINLIHDQSRIGVCLDSCHLHDAGYPVKDHFDDVLAEFNHIIGLNYLKVFHINDSKNEIGAKKDRHENIGYGHLGFDTLNRIVHHPYLQNIPKILETPYIQSTKYPKKSYPPYRFEIENFYQNKFEDNLLNKVLSFYEDVK